MRAGLPTFSAVGFLSVLVLIEAKTKPPAELLKVSRKAAKPGSCMEDSSISFNYRLPRFGGTHDIQRSGSAGVAAILVGNSSE